MIKNLGNVIWELFTHGIWYEKTKDTTTEEELVCLLRCVVLVCGQTDGRRKH